MNEIIEKLVHQNIQFVNLNRRAEKELQLSLVQFHLLDALEKSPGISAQSLAKKTGVHPSTFTQTVKRLTKKEFMFEMVHPRDTRKRVYGITAKGREACKNFIDGIARYLVAIE